MRFLLLAAAAGFAAPVSCQDPPVSPAPALWADRSALSIAAGGTVHFELRAGSAQTGDLYLLLGSLTGTAPGVLVGSVLLPLNQDYFLDFACAFANSPMLVDTAGVLRRGGAASAAFVLPPALVPPALAGLHLDFACLVGDSGTMQARAASNTVPLVLGP